MKFKKIKLTKILKDNFIRILEKIYIINKNEFLFKFKWNLKQNKKHYLQHIHNLFKLNCMFVIKNKKDIEKKTEIN